MVGFSATAVPAVGVSDRHGALHERQGSANVRVVREAGARPAPRKAPWQGATGGRVPPAPRPTAPRRPAPAEEGALPVEDEVLAHDASGATPARGAGGAAAGAEGAAEGGTEEAEAVAAALAGVDLTVRGRGVRQGGAAAGHRGSLLQDELEGLQEDDELALESQFADMSQLADAVVDAIQRLSRALEDDTSSALSAATRRLIVKKAVSQMRYAGAQLDSLKRSFGVAKAEALRLRAQSQNAVRARRQVAERLNQVMAQLEGEGQAIMGARDEAQAARDAQREAEKRLAVLERDLAHAAQGQAKEAARADGLSATMDEAKEAKRHAEERMAVAEDVAASASDAAAAAKAGLGAVEARAGKAEEDLKRAKEVVAKLTADNLVLMMKHETAAKALKNVEAERDTLKAALDKEHDAWLETARVEVESAVRDAMAAADAATDAAEAASSGAKEAARAATARAEAAEGQRDANATELAALTVRLAEADARLEGSDFARAEATASLEAASERLHELTTEHRLTNQALSQARNELTASTVAYHELQAKHSAAEGELRAAMRAGERAQEELATQRAVNGVLMRKKEEVEWQLMAVEARASDWGEGQTQGQAQAQEGEEEQLPVEEAAQLAAVATPAAAPQEVPGPAPRGWYGDEGGGANSSPEEVLTATPYLSPLPALRPSRENLAAMADAASPEQPDPDAS